MTKTPINFEDIRVGDLVRAETRDDPEIATEMRVTWRDDTHIDPGSWRKSVPRPRNWFLLDRPAPPVAPLPTALGSVVEKDGVKWFLLNRTTRPWISLGSGSWARDADLAGATVLFDAGKPQPQPEAVTAREVIAAVRAYLPPTSHYRADAFTILRAGLDRLEIKLNGEKP